MLRMTRRQDGFALVTAIMVMSLCLMLGFGLLSLVQRQQADSRMQRERESSFAVSEGALNAQIFQLSNKWPTGSGVGFVYPPKCTQASVGAGCPTASTLTKAFQGADYGAGIEWSTEVHDVPRTHTTRTVTA
jgi:Tfp pilus assembly protein PilX